MLLRWRFDFADELRVWSYDKADYTIRMDVETGMFEDVLLAAMSGGGPGGMDSAGMNARGMNARGMNARGMNARGMNARGMNARGGGTIAIEWEERRALAARLAPYHVEDRRRFRINDAEA